MEERKKELIFANHHTKVPSTFEMSEFGGSDGKSGGADFSLLDNFRGRYAKNTIRRKK